MPEQARGRRARRCWTRQRRRRQNAGLPGAQARACAPALRRLTLLGRRQGGWPQREAGGVWDGAGSDARVLQATPSGAAELALAAGRRRRRGLRQDEAGGAPPPAQPLAAGARPARRARSAVQEQAKRSGTRRLGRRTPGATSRKAGPERGLSHVRARSAGPSRLSLTGLRLAGSVQGLAQRSGRGPAVAAAGPGRPGTAARRYTCDTPAVQAAQRLYQECARPASKPRDRQQERRRQPAAAGRRSLNRRQPPLPQPSQLPQPAAARSPRAHSRCPAHRALLPLPAGLPTTLPGVACSRAAQRREGGGR